MGVVLKKFLPLIMRNTRWGELITVFQDIVNDLKTECINVIKTKHMTDLMTNAEILEEAHKLGYNLLSLDGDTSTDEYLKRELLTIVPRISYKNARTGYKYIYYIYNLMGETYPIELTLNNIFHVIDDYWSTVVLREITSYTLDTGGYLDSPSTWLSYLDQNISSTTAPTRNFVLSFSPRFIETASEFLSLNTLKCFLNDVLQMKRATEIPYFEYKLLIPGYTNKTVYTQNYTNYNSTISGSIQSILINGNLLDLNKIQIGNGVYTTLDTSITGVQSPISCGGDITTPDNAISGGDYSGSSNLYAFNKQASYENTEITQGYQSWGFTVPKTNLSNSGLSNSLTIYSGLISVDNVSNSITVLGRNAQTLQGVIQEINNDISGAYAAFDTVGNGTIKITSRTLGINSKISIGSGNIFSSLLNANTTATTEINGVDTSNAWRSSQTGSGTLGQAYIGQNGLSIGYKISKIKYKNSPNDKDNVSSVKVQWKYPSDVLWNDLITSTAVTDPSYWNTITVPNFTLSGVIKTSVNKFVTVGSSGEIQTSTDGLTWTHQTPANNYTGTFNDITNNSTTFFVVGTSGEIQTSINATTWTHQVPSGGFKGNFNGVIYGSGLVVAVGSSGVIQYSSNGTNWNQVILANEASNVLNKVQYGNKRYLIAGNNGKVYTSLSGDIWTNYPLNGMFDGDYLGVSTAGNLSFILGKKGIIEKSYNGLYWNQVSGIVESDIQKSLYDIALSSGSLLYAAVGYNNTTNQTLIETSSDLNTWTNRTPASTSNTLKEIVAGSDKFVTVGTNGEIEYSYDGNSWNKINTSGSGSLFNWSYSNTPGESHRLINDGTQLITCGQYGNIFTSPDGMNWTSKYSGLTGYSKPNFLGIAYGNNIYVATGGSGVIDAILSSTDLINWTVRQNTNNFLISDIVYGNGKFVGSGANGGLLPSGSGCIYTSTDGLNWSAYYGYSYNDGYALKIAYLNNLYYKLTAGYALQSSIDGIIWSTKLTASHTLYDINYSNNLFVTVGEAGLIYTSSDGNTWIQRTAANGFSDPFLKITYANGMYIAMGLGGELQTSINGIDWVHKENSVDNSTVGPVTGLTYFNNLIVGASANDNVNQSRLYYSSFNNSILNYSSNLNSLIYEQLTQSLSYISVGDLDPSTGYAGILTSSSGTVWTKQNSIQNDSLKKIIYDGNQYVTLGNEITYTSTSGNIWAPQSSLNVSAGSLNSIAYSSATGNYVTVGNSGLIKSSPNLTTWTQRIPANGYNGNFAKVVHNGHNYIAAGQYGEIQSSYDGIDWIHRGSSAAGTANLQNITYGNGVYIAISDEDSKIYYSPNLSTWYRNQGSQKGNSYYGIVYGAGIFVIVGSNGDIETTTDGTVMVKRTSAGGYTGTFYGINYKNSLFIANGTNGEIQTSPDGIIWTQRVAANSYIGTFHGTAYVGTNITSSNSTYMLRLLANSALNTNYYWELFNLQMSTDNLTLLELYHLKTLTANQLYARRIITEKNTFPTFTEMAVKNINDDCIFYAKFPAVQWDKKMYGNPLFKINLT